MTYHVLRWDNWSEVDGKRGLEGLEAMLNSERSNGRKLAQLVVHSEDIYLVILEDDLAGEAASTVANLRLFESGDWEVMRALRLRALATDPGAFGSTIDREVAFGEETWRQRCEARRNVLAELAGAAIGLAGWYGREDEPGTFELVSMWVAPEHRRKGVARLLVGRVIEEARHLGARRLALFVSDGNLVAESFYASMGFSPTGRHQPLPSNEALGEHEMAMDLVTP
jgi:GNAT superfamily N-acetyltransferase